MRKEKTLVRVLLPRVKCDGGNGQGRTFALFDCRGKLLYGWHSIGWPLVLFLAFIWGSMHLRGFGLAYGDGDP